MLKIFKACFGDSSHSVDSLPKQSIGDSKLESMQVVSGDSGCKVDGTPDCRETPTDTVSVVLSDSKSNAGVTEINSPTEVESEADALVGLAVCGVVALCACCMRAVVGPPPTTSSPSRPSRNGHDPEGVMQFQRMNQQRRDFERVYNKPAPF